MGGGRMEVRGDPGKPRTKLAMGRIRGGGSPGPSPPVKDLDFYFQICFYFEAGLCVCVSRGGGGGLLTIYNDLSFGACCFFFFMHIWLDTQQGQVALETKVMVNAQVGVEVQEGVYCLDINLQ